MDGRAGMHWWAVGYQLTKLKLGRELTRRPEWEILEFHHSSPLVHNLEVNSQHCRQHRLELQRTCPLLKLHQSVVLYIENTAE